MKETERIEDERHSKKEWETRKKVTPDHNKQKSRASKA